jgi:hypothetical protein
MTHPNMKARLPLLITLMSDRAHFGSSPSADMQMRRPPEAVRAPAGEAANDDEPRKWYRIQNPLWVIVIGMATLFAAMALIVALG